MFVKKATKILCIVIAIVILTSCNAKNPTKTNDKQTSNNTTEKGTEKATKDLIYIAALDMPKDKKIKLVSEYNGNQAVTWSSSNPSIASVSQNGEIKALAKGETIITATVGDTSDTCRVTITGNMTLAYLNDPGTLNADGERVPPGKGGENYPVFIPGGQDSLSKAFFKDGEYAWKIIIDEEFNTNLKVPMTDFSYIVKNHVILDAGRVGGSTLTGEYKGKLNVEMAIDKESFIAAMKKQSGEDAIIDFNSNFIVQTSDVNFTVTPYNEDEADKAKNAFISSKPTIIPAPLVKNSAMVISTAKCKVSGSTGIKANEGGGFGNINGKNGDIPFVIEVSENGRVVMYMPRMLVMCDRNWVSGQIIKLRILDLP